ncbi:hypothetical protein FKV68_29820 (plasmid) [Sinorhizobium mexicanum]|uniref:Uncharacterized protein n=1 Tax=Sinorhizobium mexicanum TaxID=375549 RepID=A0A859QG52_9HYPH|nr:hypothetical protein FKV68_29820 [Sinorhizobium mexicanum]
MQLLLVMYCALDCLRFRPYSAAPDKMRKGRCSVLNCCMSLSLNRLRSKEHAAGSVQHLAGNDDALNFT